MNTGPAHVPPTERQLATLRRIAYASKRSFAWPQTRAQASHEIDRMMRTRYTRRKKRPARKT